MAKAREAAKAKRLAAQAAKSEEFSAADDPEKAKREREVAMNRTRAALKEPRLGTPKHTRTFIYRPQEEGDRLEIEMAGIRFKANTPVEVADNVTITQLLREERETPDGMRSRAIERKVPLWQVVAGNPWFEVDGKQPQRTQANTRLPDGPDAYRNYAIQWIAASMSARAMDLRWVSEEGLRQRCGLTNEDRNYIMPFFQARHQECAELDAQRAA
jgi:hypothetical protein